MKPQIFTIAAKRRLRMPVMIPGFCAVCNKHQLDEMCEHAIMCGASGSWNIRHNEVRDLIYKSALHAGFRAGKEHKGGLSGADKRRPGDVIIFDFREHGKHELIDCRAFNPLAPSYATKLVAEGGPGALATVMEDVKWATYPEYARGGRLAESSGLRPFSLERLPELGTRQRSSAMP